ncbi:MAG: response regulator transcription factor [Saprospiraceae bacterium]|nr:response regulator transcription factor [Saprospiraceae bacterium]
MKIIIADDHPLFRQGIKQAIESIPNAELVGEAGDGMEAYHLVLSEVPDIVILDLEMPLLNGLELCKKLRSDFKNIRVVILTMHKEKHYFDAAIEAGVNGYLLKDNAVEDILDCIKTVWLGQPYVSDHVRDRLLETEEDQTLKLVASKLTPTENVVLKLVAEGKTTSEIAKLLFSSPNTIENHRANISRKLELEPEKNALLKFALKLKKS